MNCDEKTFYEDEVIYDNECDKRYEHERFLEILVKDISVFAINERKRYYELYRNNYHLFCQLQEKYKTNDYCKGPFDLIIDNNCEWTKYNLLQLEMVLIIIQEVFIGKFSTITYVKDKTENEKFKQELREQIKWFINKLNIICQSRYNYNPQYFNEVEENCFFKKELKTFSSGRGMSDIYDKMLNCLSKIIDVINRGHCYFYEISLNINMTYGKSCVEEAYMEKINQIRDSYFQEIFALIHKYMDNLLTK